MDKIQIKADHHWIKEKLVRFEEAEEPQIKQNMESFFGKNKVGKKEIHALNPFKEKTNQMPDANRVPVIKEKWYFRGEYLGQGAYAKCYEVE